MGVTSASLVRRHIAQDGREIYGKVASGIKGDTRAVRIAFAPLVCMVAMIASVSSSPAFAGMLDAVQSRPFEIADGISSTRFMAAGDGSKVFVSPDGERFMVALISGDLASDLVRLDIRVGHISNGQPTAPISVVKLTTTGLSATRPGDSFGDSGLTDNPSTNFVRWIDNRHVGLLWSDEKSHKQVYVLDVVSGRGRLVTHEKEDVLAFVASPTGALIADVRTPPDRTAGDRAYKAGFTMSGTQLSPLLAGYGPGTRAFAFADFTRRVGSWRTESLAPLRATGAMSRQNYFTMLQPAYSPTDSIISPDGRFALTDETPVGYEHRWLDYKTPELELFRRASGCRQPEGAPNRCLIRQLYLADLKSGTSTPIVDAPLMLGDVKRVSWSPSGRWLLLGPTYLPASGDVQRGEKGWVVIDLGTRSAVAYLRLPEARKDAKIEWTGDDRFDFITTSGDFLSVVKNGVVWKVNDTPIPSIPASSSVSPNLTVIENSNIPPRLYFEDRDGKLTLLLDPNPKLAGYDLARVEMVTWKDSEGAEWQGRLYIPKGAATGPRPLVVQEYPYATAEEFSLYGPGPSGWGIGLGPGRSAFIAQALATRGIAVLQVGGAPLNRPRDYSVRGTEYDKLDRGCRGIAAGIAQLAKRGLIDSSRVGVMGWSATARLVEHAITLGEFPYVAALIDDGADRNYLKNLMYRYGDSGDGSDTNERMSTQEFVKWIAQSPALNADRVQTPVYYQVSSPIGGYSGVMQYWEMYSALNAYNRPVEYYVIPDFLKGAHALQNPHQLMTVQSRALDWWLFWLKGERDTSPQKREQYESWERMRQLAEKVRQEPRRPLLEWQSKPK